jgi:ankyrin repeat protein
VIFFVSKSSFGKKKKMLSNELILKAADIGFANAIKNNLARIDPRYQHTRDSSSGFNRGVDALMLACRSGHEEIVKMFLSPSSRTSSTSNDHDDDDAKTKQNKDEKLIMFDPSRSDAEQWTCLHYASFSGHFRVAALLLSTNKCNISLETTFEKATALGFAQHRRFRETVRVLSSTSSSSRNETKNLDDDERKNSEAVWTFQDRLVCLEKYVRKLRESCPMIKDAVTAKKVHIPKRVQQQQQQQIGPNVIAGTFLFRYQMTLENFQELEQFLLSFMNVELPKEEREQFVILDAVDLMLNLEKDMAPLLFFENQGKKIEEKETIFDVLFKNDVQNDGKNECCLPVKLIVHCDFQLHQQMAETMFRSQNNSSWRILRSSSINGLEHLIVVAKI